MISEIVIQNFKSYKNTTLKLAPLTLLVGANASGKSNAIEAIRFLSWLADGRRIDDILDSIQREDISIRGFSRDLIYDQACTPTLTLGCALTNSDEWKRLEISISLEDGVEPSVIAERIWREIDLVPLYESEKAGKRRLAVSYKVFKGDAKKNWRKSSYPLAFTSDQVLFPQLENVVNDYIFGSTAKIIREVTCKFRNALKQVLFFDPNPRSMGTYSFITDSILRDDGSNLSSVLYHLCHKEDQKDDILDFIRSLPEQDITDINFIHTPRDEVMVQLTESFGEQATLRDAPLLSDGTLRILAVAAALLSAPHGSLVILEEIDNGIHPSRAGVLLQNIQKVAIDRKLHVLLTSHNPALLDSLPDSAIPNVVFCYRDPDVGDSRLVRLADLGDYPELIARGPLGQLLTNGIIDRYAKQQRDPEQKLNDAMSWLESLKAQVEAADV